MFTAKTKMLSTKGNTKYNINTNHSILLEGTILDLWSHIYIYIFFVCFENAVVSSNMETSYVSSSKMNKTIGTVGSSRVSPTGL